MDENIPGTMWLIVAIVIGVVLVAVGVLILHKQDIIRPESTFDINPTKAQSNQNFTEPEVATWLTYSNATYNFSIDYPSGWQTQEYPSPQPGGGFMVAFSPDRLPCNTCTYFRNGYYSVRIYNQKSDPDYYKDFQSRMANVGKAAGYQGAMIGKYKGVLTDNTAAFDHGDWVIEANLDKNDGNLKISDSKIFQHVLSSLRFTELLFNQ